MKMNWGRLNDICMAFRRAKKTAFTQEELDRYTKDPVRMAVLEAIAVQISVHINAMGRLSNTPTEDAYYKGMIQALQWFLVGQQTLEARISEVDSRENRTRSAVAQAIAILDRIPIKDEDDET